MIQAHAAGSMEFLFFFSFCLISMEKYRSDSSAAVDSGSLGGLRGPAIGFARGTADQQNRTDRKEKKRETERFLQFQQPPRIRLGPKKWRRERKRQAIKKRAQHSLL